ncbi:MAG: hypothetical protein AUK54_08765 [Helicobacteraceae bacterium CG2_30_36_10]|nr:MAG: hypothetical protein AUK54_08765 [Helicobacteraceae bacterium CG2_30_36_10]
MNYPDEWTQKEFLHNKKKLEEEGKLVVLVDTILSPIDKANTQTYNPYELQNLPLGSVFVFYCDSGKATLKRLKEYKIKFPQHHCISLKGGRGYWRKNMSIFEEPSK